MLDNLWKDEINPETGEHSLHIHELKPVKQWCAFEQHLFQPDIPQNRKIHCMVCGQEVTFVVGYHQLIDGHLVVKS